MSDRNTTTLQSSNNALLNHRLSQSQAAPFLDSSYDFQSFVPSNNAYGLTDSSSSGNSNGESQFSFPARHHSQSDIAGSPTSSYAPSVSDGRNSISYSSTPFKIPAAVNQDRRTSSPAVVARGQQLAHSGNTFAAPLASQQDMNTSHWTPNFSFGGSPQNGHDTVKAQQRYSDQYNASYPVRQSQISQQRRGSHGFGGAGGEMPTQYNYDRRMSHPVLPSQSFDPAAAMQRQRQQSAVDWRSFAATNNALRLSQPDGTHHFPGSDGLWNTLDSARGMVAMSHQDPSSAELFKQNMARRSSIPYLPESTISEDRSVNDDGSSIFSRYSSIGSNEDPIAMQPAGAISDSTPDQASMMNTFSAKDNNTGHKKHVCPVCRKRFTRPSSLTTHIYSHTGEKPFSCDVENCGRQFSVISNLRRHKKTHGADIKESPEEEEDSSVPETVMQPTI